MNSSKIVDLSKLTLVMPTCNRQNFAIRNMKYWSNTNVKLIVIDDSPKAIDQNIIQSVSKNINYIHLEKSWKERIMTAFDLVNTEYVQLIADDEFYIISAIENCIKELENNESIVSCTGCCLKFVVNKEDKKIYSKYVYHRLYNNYQHTIHENPKNRLVSFMKNYHPFPIYSITRSSVWKKAFKIPTIQKFYLYAYEEIQINMFLSFAGKCKVIKELLWLRSEGENIPVRDGFIDKQEPLNSFENWWSSEKNQRDNFVEIMVENLSDFNHDPDLNSKDLVNESLKNYLLGGADWEKNRMNYVKEEKGILIFYLILIINLIKKYIPKKIKNLIKSTKIWKSNQKSFLEGANFLEKKGIKVDYDSLSKIEKIILDFHKKK